MEVINRKLSIKLNELGFNIKNHFYYVTDNNITRLCTKTYKDNFVVIKGPKTSKLIKNDKNITIIPTYTLSEINDTLKYYSKYFKVYYDINEKIWKLDKTIFKLFFLNYNKRKYIKKFENIINKKYDKEIDIKGDLLYFLLKTDFISINDIK
jgi:hypothetical protein